LQQDAGKDTTIHPISVDYHNAQDLDTKLKDAVQNFGVVSLAVVWIHSTAIGSGAPTIIAKHVGSDHIKGRYFHVLGSARRDPSRQDSERTDSFKPFKQMTYHEIFLGFVIEGDHSRWLKHDEVSNGVIESIEQNKAVHIIGTVSPWDKHPH